MIEENLKKMRLELGLSVAKLAQKLDIPAMTLTKYERGERTPSAQLFIQLYKKLNVNMNWFVSGDGEMFNNIINNHNIENELSLRVTRIEELLKIKRII